MLAGFGSQHRKMAKSLYLRDQTFAESINKVDSLVQDELGYSIVELILDDSKDYDIETTQAVIFAIQIALGELLKATARNPLRWWASRSARRLRRTSRVAFRWPTPPARSAPGPTSWVRARQCCSASTSG